MTDQETIERFKFLRSQGWSFNRIAVELNVSKPMLIKWGRQHQFEIANLRATETEGLIEKFFKPQHERLKQLSSLMQRIEQELEQRKLAQRVCSAWPPACAPRSRVKQPCRHLPKRPATFRQRNTWKK
jgi:hypothetical protein